MDPPLTLLNPKFPPFTFRHQMGFGDQLGYVLRKRDMPFLSLSQESIPACFHKCAMETQKGRGLRLLTEVDISRVRTNSCSLVRLILQ